MSDEKPPGVEETPALFDAEIEPAPPLADEEEAALLQAEADADAGRVVPHSEVAKWLKTWGTPEEGPPPKSWFS
jgi:predicted transcriptional regulator